ncbi:hypothetical protein QBC39DRAFT_359292 [Podospora conica]|nr:hypothetical protein QBC39DRAFT_359292 [Schizothecium conicum]
MGLDLHWILGLQLLLLLLPRLEGGTQEQTTTKRKGKMGRTVVYISCRTQRGRGSGSLREEGARWLDTLTPEDLFCVSDHHLTRRLVDGGDTGADCIYTMMRSPEISEENRH